MLVPGWLLGVIAKCLEKRPDNRFANGVELHEAIIKNSDEHAASYAYDNSDSAVLKRENERLKALLAQHQGSSGKVAAAAAVAMAKPDGQPKAPSPFLNRTKRHDGWLNTSSLGSLKPVIIGLGILLASLALFAAYSSFSSADPEAIDSVAFKAEKQRIVDSLDNAERLNAQRVQDSIDDARRVSASREPVSYQPNNDRSSEKQRERRKKEEEKQWEREKKDAEKLKEELKKQFEKLKEGKGD